jgi:hypothetical protein
MRIYINTHSEAISIVWKVSCLKFRYYLLHVSSCKEQWHNGKCGSCSRWRERHPCQQLNDVLPDNRTYQKERADLSFGKTRTWPARSSTREFMMGSQFSLLFRCSSPIALYNNLHKHTPIVTPSKRPSPIIHGIHDSERRAG